MKEWLKKNAISMIGNFFVWIVPLILLLIITLNFEKVSQESWVFRGCIWGAIFLVAYLLAYYKKLKHLITQRKTIQIAKLGRCKIWIRIIEWVSYILPYVVGLLLIVAIENNYEELCKELKMFFILVMASATLGYIALSVDSGIKSKVE